MARDFVKATNARVAMQIVFYEVSNSLDTVTSAGGGEQLERGEHVTITTFEGQN